MKFIFVLCYERSAAQAGAKKNCFVNSIFKWDRLDEINVLYCATSDQRHSNGKGFPPSLPPSDPFYDRGSTFPLFFF